MAALQLFWRPAAGLLAPFILLVLVACGAPAATATPAPAAQPTPTSAVGETPQATPVADATPTPASPAATVPTGTLNVGQTGLGPYMGHPRLTPNPQLYVNSTAITEGLLTHDNTGQVVPLLAESWSISEDFLTWTFNLRQGVEFHKGYGEMTAEDVIWSYHEWGQSSVHPRGSLIRDFWENPAGSVSAPDPYTVMVNSGTPFSDIPIVEFLRVPGGPATWVASKRQSDEMGVEAANARTAVTGPWELEEARTGEFWRMKAVEDHWRQTPYFAELVFWEIPEESSLLAGFQTGQLDTFTMSFDSIALVEQVPGAQFVTVPNASVSALNFYGQFYVGIGTEQQRAGYDPGLPWVSADPDVNSEAWDRARKVRLALSLAIDRQAIVDTLLWGFGRPALLTDFSGGHEELVDFAEWEFDPEEARRLLSEVGLDRGFSITLITAIRAAPSEVEACESLGTMWNDIGVDVRFQRVPYETLRPQLVGRTYQGATCHAGPPRMAPVQGFVNHTVPGGFNYGVEHPWLEEKIAQAQGTVDPVQRAALEREIGRFFIDNVMTNVGLYSTDAVWQVGPRIEPWGDYVRVGDIRNMNGYEYIRPR
jgi:ABC-type transport system substrate-binding protein